MFDRVVVINLDRRPERLASFMSRMPMDWPFATVERVPAFDGERITPPSWYGGEHRSRFFSAWGCFQSHLHIWKAALDAGLESVLIFEDDAVFGPCFSKLATDFVRDVPDDWDQIYFGGQHLRFSETPPVQVNEQVVLGRNVNRTHAYAIRRPMMEFCIERLDREWPPQSPTNYYNFDFQLGLLHSRENRKPYCPRKWLCGQAAGKSDVAAEVTFMRTCWWNEFPVVNAKREAVPC